MNQKLIDGTEDWRHYFDLIWLVDRLAGSLIHFVCFIDWVLHWQVGWLWGLGTMSKQVWQHITHEIPPEYFKFSQWQWPIAMSKNEWSRCQLSNWLFVFHLVIVSCLHCRSFIPTRFVWSSMLPHLVWRSTTNIVKQQKIWWRTSVSTNLLLPLSLDHG